MLRNGKLLIGLVGQWYPGRLEVRQNKRDRPLCKREAVGSKPREGESLSKTLFKEYW